MKFFRLVLRNTLRHKLRTFLTIMGIAIAILAFALLRTVVGAFYAGVDTAAVDRLVVRHAVSFIFSLPISYMDKLKTVPGVDDVTYAAWFGGVYKDPTKFENFFARLAVKPDNFFKIYSEYQVPEDQFQAFLKERNAAIIGEETARKHHLKIGDTIPMKGDIYPGNWQFVVRGIYKGRDKSVDETALIFNWEYLNEQIKKDFPLRANKIGWYVVKVHNMNQSAFVSQKIDALFKNSAAETKTETEKAFNQSFLSMYSSIITAMNFISFVIVGIILLVLANTIAMTTRERTTEYAVLKTLGFKGGHLTGMISGEALMISMLGGAMGLFFAFPIAKGFQTAFPTLFPILPDPRWTIIWGLLAAFTVGLVSSIFPAMRVSKMRIVDGLRHID
jgi:putative ABC transport system permease protein